MGFVKHGFVLSLYFLIVLQTTKRDGSPSVQSLIPVSEFYDYAIEQVMMLGGDTDTNAAITGGVVGAYVQIVNIPAEKL